MRCSDTPVMEAGDVPEMNEDPGEDDWLVRGEPVTSQGAFHRNVAV